MASHREIWSNSIETIGETCPAIDKASGDTIDSINDIVESILGDAREDLTDAVGAEILKLVELVKTQTTGLRAGLNSWVERALDAESEIFDLKDEIKTLKDEIADLRAENEALGS